jgi:hypothetical protein
MLRIKKFGLIAILLVLIITVIIGLAMPVDAQDTGTIVFVLTIGSTGWSHISTINGVQGTNISNLDNITTTKIETINGIAP